MENEILKYKRDCVIVLGDLSKKEWFEIPLFSNRSFIIYRQAFHSESEKVIREYEVDTYRIKVTRLPGCFIVSGIDGDYNQRLVLPSKTDEIKKIDQDTKKGVKAI